MQKKKNSNAKLENAKCGFDDVWLGFRVNSLTKHYDDDCYKLNIDGL